MKLLVDVHAHLDLKQFENDIDEVIDRAKVAGVKAIICNSTTPKSMRETIKISKKYGDIIKLALGIFPTDATKLSKEEIESEIEFIRNHKKQIVAIGEIGLDFHWEKDENNRNRQIEIFKKFLSLAKEIDKPIIVHTWDAELKVIEILEEEKMKRAEEAQEKRLIEEAMREEGFISAEEKKAQTEKSREGWIEIGEKLGVKVKIGKENIQKKLFK